MDALIVLLILFQLKMLLACKVVLSMIMDQLSQVQVLAINASKSVLKVIKLIKIIIYIGEFENNLVGSGDY